jgi:sigma-B regulation protein RsbU (phosphoserine phosphatase)
MSTDSNPSANAKHRSGRLRTFWESVTEGLELHQLWGQFVSEARASYRLFSADVDWNEIDSRSRGPKRFVRAIWALFKAMLMMLTPSLRVLLLVAIVLLVMPEAVHLNHMPYFSFQIHARGWGIAILFILLALELADRVTMKRDLEIAREIQEWLVPDRPPGVPGLDIAFATRPQNTVAGDYYDAFLRPVPVHDTGKQPLLVAVADVAGKSVPAALLMATFQASLQALSATSGTLDEIVIGLDRYCRAHSLDGRRFTTAFLAEIDVDTHEMWYINAGHNEPILRRASGAVERLSTGGPPFGIPIFSQTAAPYPSGRVQLQAGDILFIFTDGVVEAVNDADEEYGEVRLLRCIQATPTESANAILNRVMGEVNSFVGNARQFDDITSFVVRVGA